MTRLTPRVRTSSLPMLKACCEPLANRGVYILALERAAGTGTAHNN